MEPIAEISSLPDGFAAAPVNLRRTRTPSRVNDFYELAKPRLNMMVLITTMVGYFMAVRSAGDWSPVWYTLLGTALTAAGSGALNQFLERDYDKLMPRTHKRPLPAGRIKAAEALVYGLVLGIAGVVCLMCLVNVLTGMLALLTLVTYIFIYTPMKRRTSLNTVVGAVAGAIPPMMGWTAVQNSLGAPAAVLFCILFFWQMPHFLAIAIMYRRDYELGGFKMLPVVDKDLTITGRQIMLYGAALIPVTMMPSLFGMSGVVYFVSALVLGLGYLSFGIACAVTRERVDARKLFFSSIIYLPVLLTVMMLNKL